MVFQPGNPKPPGSGRQKGTPNKRTAELNDQLTEFLLRRMPQMDDMIDGLLNKDAVAAVTRLISLGLPRRPTYSELYTETDVAEPQTGPDETLILPDRHT